MFQVSIELKAAESPYRSMGPVAVAGDDAATPSSHRKAGTTDREIGDGSLTAL